MLILIFTLPTYAAEANVIFERDSASNNKVKVILEVSDEQSVTKANVVLDVKPSNRENLKNAEFTFSNEISRNSKTAKWTYNNDKVNLYVVSKNELGNKSSNWKKTIELGTLTINTNNDSEQTLVDISTVNGGVTIASVDHRIANITNDTSALAQLKIGTATSGDNNQPGSDNSGNKPPENNQPGGSNSGNNGGNQSNGNNNSNSGNRIPENGSNNNNTNSVNDNEIEDEDTNTVLDNNTVKNEVINNTKNTVQSSKELPETGEEEKSYIWIAIVIILILFATAGIIASRLTKNKKHKGNYRL